MDAVRRAIQGYVDAGQLAGAAALAWRKGEAPQVACAGFRDLAAGLPVERDTLFRVASLSKPVTCACALALMEQGRFALDEPIAARWAPEFAAMRVLKDPEGPLDDTAPAARPITFRDLFTHTSGLTHSGFHTGPIAAAYDEALGGDIDSWVAPEDWIARLARLPLIDQPGGDVHYGCNTDLLGLLIARMEARPLEAVLRERLFAPLGMADTGFSVPPDKRGRRAKMYGFTDDGVLAERPTGAPGAGAFHEARPAEMAYVSGGAGLWSTLDDYLAFARIFVEGGRGVLQPATVALMMRNHLSEGQRARGTMLGMLAFTGHGFGLGVAVVLDPATAPAVRCKGGVGTVGWPGAYGGWWQADPTTGQVLVFLAHNLLQLDQMQEGIGLAVYGAIGEFHALATSAISGA